MSEAALTALAEELRASGGLLAGAAVDPGPEADGSHGAQAAAGPAAAGAPGEYALLVEAIREGYLLHFATPRVLASGDPDLDLLAGDHLYALGLDRLARLGDLEAVGILAGVIARSARAHAEDRPHDADDAWREGARAVGHRT